MSQKRTRSINWDKEEKLNYTVVIFSHEEEEEYVSAAPKKWLCENETIKWPRNKAIEKKAIKLNMNPEEDWITYPIIRIVGYYATLQEATSVEINKQNSSSSESEMVLKSEQRKRKIKKKYRNDSISPPPVTEIKEGEFPSTSDIMKARIIMLDENRSPDENLNPPNENLRPTNESVVQSPDGANRHESVKPIYSSLSDASTGAGSSTSSMDTIMSELKEITKLVTYTMRKVEAIESSINRLNLPSEKNPSLLPNLPLIELAQLKSLEEKLGDENIQEELFNMLRHTGGSKERDCVYRCLEKVFSDYLAQYCSWTGKKSNFKLSHLKLMTTLKLAVKQSFPNLSEESFERHVMSWFQQATTRLKRQN